jgi:ATP-dependent RNA helicase DDX24/MAK5
MAPVVGCKARGDADHAQKSKKRKRSDNATSPPSKKKKKSATFHGVDADALNWKEVALPDRLEDAEGFFGLEEIEGVDVLKPEGPGKLPRFKV